MAKYILRHGCEKPTSEAYVCPDCGYKEENYELAEQMFHNPCRATLHCSATDMPFVKPLVPTFTCLMCGCVWQWENDPPKQKKEDENANPV